jgi:serine/threonine-protein kinase HipA
MAKASGINIMECKMLEEGGRAHLLTKRFDRDGNERNQVINLASLGHFGWNPMGRTSLKKLLTEDLNGHVSQRKQALVIV